MRRLRTPLGVFVLAAVTATCFADSRNAATWYRRVVELLGWDYEADFATPRDERLLTDDEMNLIIDYRAGVSGEPSPELRQALAKARPVIDLVRRGSQQHYSDFELDYSQGFALMLPHLSNLRNAARIMHADAQVHLHDGDISGATDRMASLYRMSGHIGSDRIIISSLVGAAVFNYTDGVTQQAMDRGELSAFDSAILVNALNTLDERDPFNFVEGVVGEQVIAVDWMAQKFATQEDRQAFHKEWGGFFGDEDFDRQFISLTDDEFAVEIDLYDQYMGRVIEAFMLDDHEAGKAALAQLREEADAGEFGLFGKSLSPAFDKILDQMHKSRTAVADRIADLEKIAQGQVKPEEYANAAVFYERGVKRLRQIDMARVQAVLDFQSGKAELDEPALATLAEAEDVINLFREGSEKRRCDFGYLRESRTERFCPDYVAGMRDALRLVLADAMRLLDAEDQLPAALDRLMTCHGAVAHLTGDELILSAMVAHDAFNEASALGRRMDEAGLLTDEHRKSLLNAIERAGRKDPFGYIGSIIATRDRLSDAFKYMPEKDDVEEGQPHRESATEAVKHLNGDQLLTLTAARDTVFQAGVEKRKAERIASGPEQPSVPDEGPHPLTRMNGIIDFEALVEVRDKAETIAALFDEGRIDAIFRQAERPPVGPVLEWMKRARGDLRDCIINLRPPMPDPPGPADPSEEEAGQD